MIERCVQMLQEQLPREHCELTYALPKPRDEFLDLCIDGHQIRFSIEIKHALRKTHAGPIIHLAKHLEGQGEHLLLCADRVPDELGQQLREQGVAYLDLGGNAFLRGPGLFVLITGRRRAGRATGRLNLTGTDVRLLAVFLRDRDAGETVQKELARRAGIALGGVGPARKRLTIRGVLNQVDKHRWQVRDRAEGLRLFADGWGTVVRHGLRPRRYRMLKLKGKGEIEQRLAVADPALGCLLGGERAAGHLTGLLKTDHATLHVPLGLRRAAAEQLGLVRDDEGPITLLELGQEEGEYRLKGLEVPLAHPLLVWAECVAVPDERVAQAAGRLYDRLMEFEGD